MTSAAPAGGRTSPEIRAAALDLAGRRATLDREMGDEAGQVKETRSPRGDARRVAGFRLGALRGIEIRVDASLLFAVLLVVWNLGVGLFPAQHPDWGPRMVWSVAILAAIVFFASVLAHELAHALVGRRLGVPIEGITLFLFGGIARLGGEPRSARAELLMTIVGPLTSLAIGLGATALGVWAADPGQDGEGAAAMFRAAGPIATLLLWLGPVNVFLAIFNLLPGFPLDGGRVLRAALWHATGSFDRATRWAAGIGRGVALVFVFAGMSMLFGHRLPVVGGGAVQGLWLLFIGWFLYTAAVQSYEQTLVRVSLGGVDVARLMRRDVVTVPPDLPHGALAERFLAAGEARCLPVARGETLLGLVCLPDLKRVPRAEWSLRRVGDIMTPAAALATVSPGEPVAEAQRLLAARDVDQVPVVEEGRLRGMLRRADVLRFIELWRAT